MERFLENTMYAARWLLAPIYFGLAFALLALAIKFFQEIFDILPAILALSEAELILKLLSLISKIAAIYVEPSAWGSGAGKSLIAAAIEHAREHRFVMLTLWVLATNERAKRFYVAAGFQPDGAEKTEERPGFTLHELRYRREL